MKGKLQSLKDKEIIAGASPAVGKAVVEAKPKTKKLKEKK